MQTYPHFSMAFLEVIDWCNKNTDRLDDIQICHISNFIDNTTKEFLMKSDYEASSKQLALLMTSISNSYNISIKSCFTPLIFSYLARSHTEYTKNDIDSAWNYIYSASKLSHISLTYQLKQTDKKNGSQSKKNSAKELALKLFESERSKNPTKSKASIVREIIKQVKTEAKKHNSPFSDANAKRTVRGWITKNQKDKVEESQNQELLDHIGKHLNNNS